MTHSFPTRESSDLPRRAAVGRHIYNHIDASRCQRGLLAARPFRPGGPGDFVRAAVRQFERKARGDTRRPGRAERERYVAGHRGCNDVAVGCADSRSEEHTSELQSLMRISYAVFCLKKKTKYRSTKQKKRQTGNNGLWYNNNRVIH